MSGWGYVLPTTSPPPLSLCSVPNILSSLPTRKIPPLEHFWCLYGFLCGHQPILVRNKVGTRPDRNIRDLNVFAHTAHGP